MEIKIDRQETYAVVGGFVVVSLAILILFYAMRQKKALVPVQQIAYPTSASEPYLAPTTTFIS